MTKQLDAVDEYYNSAQAHYSKFWSNDALHYGFWYPETKSLREAIRNTDRFVINKLSITPNDIVLDAGCGVGGSASYIASMTKALVFGITISNTQAFMANSHASASDSKVSISRQDYQHTAFREGAFSKLYAIESMCHAASKHEFLAEAGRLLRPGGQIALIDAFLTTTRLAPRDRRTYQRVLDGWVLPSLPELSSFPSQLRKHGFGSINFYDMQYHVQNSVDRIHLLGLLSWTSRTIKAIFSQKPRNLAAKFQRRLFSNNIARYGAFVATRL